MTYAEIERHCLSLACVTATSQWRGHRVFKVGGKMFAVLSPKDQRPQTMSFKTSEESFAILVAAKDIAPAPYLARANWVRLARLGALSGRELKAYLARAHGLVAQGLSRKKKSELGLG
ncbi:MAG TPA: MmcQ/YjbR family DNA-binding protein [Rhizomicrobium sp.]|nr:MmcQ/YjbR family DNA-binding protein [Rhizomicrobium sp.]